MTNKDKIKSLVQYVDQYQYISHEAARHILGKTWFDKMMLDPIRSKGPIESTIYPWNVLDYMNMKDSSPHKDDDLPLSKITTEKLPVDNDRLVQNSKRLFNLAKEIARKWQDNEAYIDDIKSMVLVVSDIEGL